MTPPAQLLNLDAEAISGICGSVSIACWVVVFSPQIIQNFRRGNADALSIQFIIIWLLGDAFNIVGAVLQGVLPTMTILAVYYTFADIVLLAQCFYYRGLTWRDPDPKPADAPPPAGTGRSDERTALLLPDSGRNGRAQSHQHQHQHQRRHQHQHQHQHPHQHQHHHADWTNLSPAVPLVPVESDRTLPRPPRPPPTMLQAAAWNGLVVVMVCGAGVLGWLLGEKTSSGESGGGTVKPGDGSGDDDTPLSFSLLGQAFGYLCMVAYIGSRLPQLILNYRRKSTDGLSMLFFLFACLGNITYVLSILAYDAPCRQRHHRPRPGPDQGGCRSGEAAAAYGRYILINLSWLAGSFVTFLLDLAVFAQYFVYNRGDDENGWGDEEGRRRVGREEREDDDGSMTVRGEEEEEEEEEGEEGGALTPQESEAGDEDNEGPLIQRRLRPLIRRGDSTY